MEVFNDKLHPQTPHINYDARGKKEMQERFSFGFKLDLATLKVNAVKNGWRHPREQ